MTHYVDMTSDELRMLLLVTRTQPFDDLKPVLSKMERLLEIAKASGE